MGLEKQFEHNKKHKKCEQSFIVLFVEESFSFLMGASNKQVIVGSVVVVALAISIAYMSITKPVDKEAITEEVPEVFVFNETVSSFE